MSYFLVPANLGLAFVSTAVVLFGGIGAMIQKETNKYYEAASVLIGFPISVMAWVEGLTCDSFLVHYGGHVWYDVTIPLSMIAYLVHVKISESSSKVKAE